MENEKPKPLIVNGRKDCLDEAIERIYQQYGSDLSAFFRDVEKELLLKRQEDKCSTDLKSWL